MTDTNPALKTGQISAIARLSGLSQDEVYRRFRLEGAPSPVDHVACVPVYDLEAAIAWLLPPSPPSSSSIDLQPASVRRRIAVQASPDAPDTSV